MNAYELAQRTANRLKSEGVELPESLNLIKVFQAMGQEIRSELSQGNDVVLLGVGAMVRIKDKNPSKPLSVRIGVRPSKIFIDTVGQYQEQKS